MRMKTPKRSKSDQKTIKTCLASDWSTHIHLRQDQKLLCTSSMGERLHVYDALLNSNGSSRVSDSTTKPPTINDEQKAERIHTFLCDIENITPPSRDPSLTHAAREQVRKAPDCPIALKQRYPFFPTSNGRTATKETKRRARWSSPWPLSFFLQTLVRLLLLLILT
ncbi:hypothetical protein GW17_00030793 [Ensete ventricosum]|nr:hypothetical protein GW17_00030793 [Ensete ventricosum]